MKIYFTYGQQNDKKKKEQNINVRLTYGRDKLQVRSSTKISISKEGWNFKKGEEAGIVDLLKGSRTPSESEYLQEVKDKLDHIRTYFQNEFRILRLKPKFHIMDKHDWNKWAKEELEIALGIKEAKSKVAPFFLKKYEDYIELKRNGWVKNTIDDYETARKKFEEYEKYKKHNFKTNEIDLLYYNDFQNWCYKVARLSPNTFGGYIAKLLAVLRKYRSLESIPTHTHIEEEDFKVIRETPSHTILDKDELNTLWSYKGNERLENVRDIAKVLYYVCLRYNEFEWEFKKNEKLNISKTKGGYNWNIHQRKVKANKGIPLLDPMVEMFEAEAMPYYISNQKFDKYIKELCLEVGFKDKAPNITAHTFRRSFCTNMYNDEHDEKDIIEFSGHKSVSALKSYVDKKNVSRKNSITKRSS